MNPRFTGLTKETSEFPIPIVDFTPSPPLSVIGHVTPITQGTQSASVVKTKLLSLYIEIITVCYKSHTEHNTLCCKM